MAFRQRPLILASASPQRKTLLKKLGAPFEIAPSRVSEKSTEKNPRKLTILLASRKAAAVAKKNPGSVVLGADTIVYCCGQIVGKPKNRKDSLRILNLLNGRWHAVYTGVAISVGDGSRIFSDVSVTKVKARKLAPHVLKALVGKHADKAGSYAVQDREDPFISHIKGELDNVIGLPLKTVRRLLAKAKSSFPRRRQSSKIR